MNDISLDYDLIAKRIRQYRHSLSWTQEELATHVGVSTTFIGQLERGEKKPSLETVVRLCKTLGVSVDALVLGSTLGKTEALYDELVALVERYAR